MENKKISILKNVKIIVLYQNIGGYKGPMPFSTLKNRVGGRVGEGLSLLLNIINIMCVLSSPILSYILPLN
jgi:hypothetical protein